MDRSDLQVFVAGTRTYDFTWTTNGLLQLNVVPPANTQVLITRDTKADTGDVSFQGTTPSPAALTKGFRKVLYVAQDALQRLAELRGTVTDGLASLTKLVTSETTARADADATEAQARTAADTAEATARKSADDALSVRIDATAIGTLPDASVTRAKLATGVTGELDGLRSSISAEAKSRGDADFALDTRVTTLEGRPATPADGSISTAKLADKAVTMAKLADEVTTKLNNAGFDVPTVSKAINFREKQFKLRDYGIAPDARNAASAAMNGAAYQAAFNDLQSASGASGDIVLPTEVLYMAQSLGGVTQKGLRVRGEGPKSRLYFTDFAQSAALLTVTAGSDDVPVMMEGFDVRLDNLSQANSFPALEIRGGGFLGLPKVRDIDFTASPTAEPKNFLHLINPVECLVQGVTVTGFQNSGYGVASSGIKIESDRIATDFTINSFKCVNIANGIVVVGSPTMNNNCEGANFTDCVMVNVQYGVLLTGQAYRVPGQGWKGGHINAQRACFALTKWAQFDITGAQLYLDQNNSPQAHVLVANSETVRVHDNIMYYIDALGTGISNPPSITSVLFAQGSTLCTAHGNIFQFANSNASGCIAQDGSCSALMAHHNIRSGGGNGVIGPNITDGGGSFVY